MRPWFHILLLAALAATVSCKPERPQMTEYRVSLREALRTEAPGSLEPGQEAEPVAMVHRDVITLGELVRALRVLPPYARYYYSSPDKAMLFLQNYIIMNLCAREALEAGMAGDPKVRMDLLAALEDQIRADHLADRVRAGAGGAEALERRRAALWSEHVEELRAAAEVTIHEARVRALANRISE
ncbi:MAG: hypothetical protein ABIK09_13500 [Pseudomonadota bacterium]